MTGSFCFIIVLAACALTAPLCAQDFFQQLRIGQWKSYTEMVGVRALARSGDSLWAATAGGVYLLQLSSGTFSTFTNSEGLSSNDVTAMTVDRAGRLWVGTASGFINVLNPQRGEWAEISDIRESNRVQKGIRAFYLHNDTLFVGTDFGVSVFLLSRWEFGDTYGNFGYPVQPRVNAMVVHTNRLWVATEAGVASAPLSAPNLSSPTFWSRFQPGTDPGSEFVTSIAVFRDTLYVATSSGVAHFTGSQFVVHPAFRTRPVSALLPTNNRMLVLVNSSTGFVVEALTGASDAPSVVAQRAGSSGTALLASDRTSMLWAGTAAEGLAELNGTEWRLRAPNGPRSNLFVSLAVDESGILWAASGISLRGRGFYRFDPSRPEGEQWKNFSVSDYPLMGNSPTDAVGNDYYKVSVGTKGSVWVSSWGRGVVEVVGDSVRRRIHSTSVPSLAGAVPQDPHYVVVGSVVPDAQGSTWFVNRSAINGFYLARLVNDTTLQYYSKSLVPTEGRFTAMVIDRNGTKWIANSEPHDKPATGLTYFNEDPTVVSGTRLTGGWGILTTANGLPDNNVLAVAVDRDGDVCVGTDAGMVIITDPLNPSLERSLTRARPLIGQTVQAIAVDAVNNKWVGTKEGVAVVSPDGTHLLHYYSVTTTNGKLVDDDIRAIAIDQQRGVVYIGTEKGLSSLQIAPVEPARSFSTLEIGPNPFLLPPEQPLTIRNLVASSSIKILTSSGALVREFAAQGGGRAFWDGRDEHGELVPSGIYFVVAFAENGNQITAGKVAVVRR